MSIKKAFQSSNYYDQCIVNNRYLSRFEMIRKKEDKRIPINELDLFLIGQLSEQDKTEVQRLMEENRCVNDYIQETAEIRSTMTYDKLRSVIQDRNRKTGRFEFINKIISFFTFKNLRPYPLFASVALIFLCLGVCFWKYENFFSFNSSYHGIKGSRYVDITMQIKDKRCFPGQEIKVFGNDTLRFLYRSNEKLFVQLLYSEDEGEVKKFSDNEKPFEWEGTLEERVAPVSIALEGTWKKQVVWIVVSKKELSARKAQKMIRNNKSKKSSEVYSFYLAR